MPILYRAGFNDAVASSGYDLDLRNQTNPNNYQYDGIGNIISDAQSGITKIGWTVYNKPDTIYKSAGNITYNYNTANQRISKTYNGLITWYVRDAQGNVLSVYDNADTSINWREQHFYGSSRIGMWKPNIDITDSTGSEKWQWTGYRLFELDNHLGNVLATINDVRNPYFKPSHIGPLPGPLQYFTANVLSYQDYYAFGMAMPDRQYVVDSAYRYGFNGKENDNEIMGYGNSLDYGERFEDVRIGRFRSVDPMAMKYPMLSSYQFASNSPIAYIDLDGKEADEPMDDDGEPYIEPKDPRVEQAERSLKDPYEEIRERERIEKQKAAANEEVQKNKILRRPRGERLLSKPKFPERFGGEGKPSLEELPENAPKPFNDKVPDFTKVTEEKAAQNLGSVETPYGPAEQALTPEALAARERVAAGEPLYRIGKLGVQEGAEAQFWSTENPLENPEAYEKEYGLKPGSISEKDFVEVGRVKPNSNFVTRPAPPFKGSPPGYGGGIEVVTQPGGVQLESFGTFLKK